MARPYIRHTFLIVGNNAPKPQDVAKRLRERDARQASDTRTPAQVLLNEPEPSRSALAGVVKVPNTLFVPVRLKVGKSHTTPNANPAPWRFQNK
jgi:hypothetical protein